MGLSRGINRARKRQTRRSESRGTPCQRGGDTQGLSLPIPFRPSNGASCVTGERSNPHADAPIVMASRVTDAHIGGWTGKVTLFCRCCQNVSSSAIFGDGGGGTKGLFSFISRRRVSFIHTKNPVQDKPFLLRNLRQWSIYLCGTLESRISETPFRARRARLRQAREQYRDRETAML